MRLSDLLAVGGFRLSMVSDSDALDGRPVAGAHISEMPGPAPWLAPDWVMLTLGMRLRRDARAQRELVDELSEAGICALGFGLGAPFKRVPDALIDEANRRS